MKAEQEANSSSEQFLTFVLGREEYGVTILQVQGIQGWDRVTPIPGTPDFILGVINLRGAIVPVVDLRRRFGMPAGDFGPTTVVIVVRVTTEGHERTLGLVVDAVSDVRSVSENDRMPAPDFGAAVKTDFVRGLATVDERMVILLDIDKLVSEGVLGRLQQPLSKN
jgi:purine-binding chemotaxis protein CheW